MTFRGVGWDTWEVIERFDERGMVVLNIGSPSVFVVSDFGCGGGR